MQDRKPKSANDIHLKSSSRNANFLDRRFTTRGARRNSTNSPVDLGDYIADEMFHIDLDAEDSKLTKKGELYSFT